MTTNFSTEFPIDPAKSVTDVVCLACEWILGSPHTKLLKSELDELPIDAEKTVSAASEQVTTASGNGQGFGIGGLRHILIHNFSISL